MAGRRSAPKQCANPLFVQWLGEWYDKEREKDTNFRFVLYKAYQNMQEFPEVLATGKDAMRVKGIGQKLADMLERKRMQVGAASGAGGQTLGGGGASSSQAGPGPGPGPGSSQSFESGPSNGPSTTSGAAPKKRKQAAQEPAAASDSAAAGQQPAKKKRAPKPYVPEYRSGAYALLVTLYNAKGPLLKADLMRKAEPHCNSSFTEPSDKNSYFTAWDAMSKLRDKDLVCKTGSPASYELTEPDGVNLAQACVEMGRKIMEQEAAAAGAAGFGQHGPSLPGPSTAGPRTKGPPPPSKDFIRSENLEDYLKERQAAKSKPPRAPELSRPTIVTKQPVKLAEDDGPICLDSDDDYGDGLKSAGLYGSSQQYGGGASSYGVASSSQGYGSSQQQVPSSPAIGPTSSAVHATFQFEYLESAKEMICTREKHKALVKFSGADMLLRIRFHVKQSGHPFVMSSVVDRAMAPVDGFLTGWVRDEAAPAQCPGIDVAALTKVVEPPPKKPVKAKEPELRGPPPAPDYASRPGASHVEMPRPLSAGLRNQGNGTPATPTFRGAPIVLPNRTYDVILVLDSRENKTRNYGAVQERDWMLERLHSRGIKCETRVLELGDFAWMARPKGGGEEVALDFVVERKALDDLKMSIHEGRFEEQKFRLVNCGIPNVIYVIEGMIPRNDPTWAEHLKKMYSAMSLLQVGHGFFVKQTLGKDDTLNYLAQMTLMIQQVYLMEDIYAIPGSELQKTTWREMRAEAEREDNRRYHIPFAAFNELNSKSRNLMLRDVYVKQLLCIRGVSVEKAAAIAGKYPTFKSLLDALRREPTDSAKTKLLMAVTDETAPTRRKIGKAIAERIVEVLCAKQYKQRVVAAGEDDDL